MSCFNTLYLFFLKKEIENLKSQLQSLQTELIEKEASWMKEKEDILLQKDLERRQALDVLQEQTENEYKQFLEEHKDMLDKALKAAREQHNKDKVMISLLNLVIHILILNSA